MTVGEAETIQWIPREENKLDRSRCQLSSSRTAILAEKWVCTLCSTERSARNVMIGSKTH